MFARKRLLRDKRGSAALEFALVAPPFIAMLFGVIDFGWAMNCAGRVRHSLTLEAREIGLHPTMSSNELETAVRNGVSGMDNTEITVTIDHQTVNGVTAAIATATYATSVMVPPFGAYPVNFSSSVTVPLPQS